MDQSISVEQVKNKPRRLTKFLGFLTILISVVWALIEFLVPDPIVYFYTIWRPEYVLILLSSLIFMLSISVYIWTYLKNKYLFFVASFFIYILSSFSYFVIGREYYSADFADGAPSVTLEKGSLFYRGIEFEHLNCDRKADTVACDFIVHNKRSQTDIDLGHWKVVMQDGAIFTDYKIYRGGQKSKYSSVKLDLPQGANAKINVVFYEVPSKYSEILNLGFEVNNRQSFSFKNLEIK